MLADFISSPAGLRAFLSCISADSEMFDPWLAIIFTGFSSHLEPIGSKYCIGGKQVVHGSVSIESS